MFKTIVGAGAGAVGAGAVGAGAHSRIALRLRLRNTAYYKPFLRMLSSPVDEVMVLIRYTLDDRMAIVLEYGQVAVQQLANKLLPLT
jgi:hypothetical protein